MNRTLVIDTSGKALSIALFAGKTLVKARHELIGRGHAEAVVQWIADLPDGGRAEEILVGCGPGSFTGIRAGVAAAHGLAIGWNVSARGMNALALIAANRDYGVCEGQGQGQEVLVAIDGGHGELFFQPFTIGPVRQGAPAISLKVEDAVRRFSQAHVIGNGAGRFVAARGFGKAHEGEADARLWQRLCLSETTLAVTPVYVRPPDAKPMVQC